MVQDRTGLGSCTWWRQESCSAWMCSDGQVSQAQVGGVRRRRRRQSKWKDGFRFLRWGKLGEEQGFGFTFVMLAGSGLVLAGWFEMPSTCRWGWQRGGGGQSPETRRRSGWR